MGRVLGHRVRLVGKIVAAAGCISDDGEAHLQSLLAQLVEPETWGKVVGQNVACPLSYLEDELALQREDLEMLERNVERRVRVVEELGVYKGWDGAVKPGEYEDMAKRLEGARERFLDDEGMMACERGVSEGWPLKDG